MSKGRSRLYHWLFLLLYAAFYAGFFVHRSVSPLLFGYSADHLLLLLLLAIPFLLPWAVSRLYRRLGTRRFHLLLLTLGIGLVLAYAVCSLIYYNMQRFKPPFEPFLQARPLPLDERLLEKLYQQRDDPQRPLLIVTLGGSTSVLYPELLLNKLRQQHPDKKFELLNLAQNSYTVKHALIRYGTHIDSWKPDVIIGLFGINELVRSFSAESAAVGPYDDEWSHFFGFSIRAVQLPTLESMLWDRLSYSWYRQLRIHEVEMPLGRFRSLSAYQRHLQRLAQTIMKQGSHGLFLTQPTLYKPDNIDVEKNRLYFQSTLCLTRKSYFDQEYPSSRSMTAAMVAFNQTMKEIAVNEGIHCFELDRMVPKTLEFFTDDCHWTDRGIEQVVDLIAEQLSKQGLLKKRLMEKSAQ